MKNLIQVEEEIDGTTPRTLAVSGVFPDAI